MRLHIANLFRSDALLTSTSKNFLLLLRILARMITEQIDITTNGMNEKTQMSIQVHAFMRNVLYMVPSNGKQTKKETLDGF